MKKRVLMISCNGLGNGGVQHVMMHIARNLSEEYIFDMLIFPDNRIYFDEEAEKYGTIFRIPLKKTRIDYYIRFFRILSGTYKILKREKYDVIHCNNNYESGICILAAYLAGVKVRLVHSHVILNIKEENPIRKIITGTYKFLLNHLSTHRIACSKASGDSIYTKDFEVLVNPIDLTRFDISKRRPKGKEKINFIHIGRFCDLKNQLFIVDTISKIKESFPETHLTLIGWGDEYLKCIIEAIKKYGMEDMVTFLPSDTDVLNALKTSDYMIFPSLHEGLGIALLEAQAMGVYCFASTGVPTEANAGLCDFLNLEDGHKVWAEHIINRIKKGQSPHRADRIDDYSLETYINKIKNIYG